ncbi:MAG: hypothetical protein K9K33_19055 [Desulfarculaceae bacterium]|nr:hypothetical protein [Desulfarculaceae bacterium]
MRFFSLEPGPGLFRGGHYHLKRTEFVYVVSGKGVVRLADVEGGGRFTEEVSTGDKLTLFPGLAHRYQALESMHVIEFYPGDYEADDNIRFEDW